MIRIIKFLLKIMLILVAVAIGILTYAKYVEPNTLVEKSVQVSSTFVTASSENLKLALISDTHFSKDYDLKDFQKVLDSLSENQPDLVFFVGDLFDNYYRYDGDVKEISEALLSIKAKEGKFAIFGNHDYGGGAEHEYASIMEAGGFRVLKNEYYPLDELQLSIVGIDDFMLGYGDIGKATWARDDYFNILLCHEPDIIDSILEYNIDLMLSGHTHGGQIHLPGYTEEFLPPYGQNYVKGLFDFDNHRGTSLYVTPGLGTTKIPLRLFSKPEVTYITLSAS